MKFFTTSDDQFLRLADDGGQRASALARLKTRRASCYIGGMALIIASSAMTLTGHDMGYGLLFVALGFLFLAFKYESDIRILQMVGHLRKRSDKATVPPNKI